MTCAEALLAPKIMSAPATEAIASFVILVPPLPSVKLSDCRLVPPKRGNRYELMLELVINGSLCFYRYGISAAWTRFALRISTTFRSMLTSKCKRGAGRVPLATADENIFNPHHRPALAHGSGRYGGSRIRVRDRSGTIF
jgi:hypothetical protein